MGWMNFRIGEEEENIIATHEGTEENSIHQRI